MIHTYTLFDKNIVLDVNSGAVFEFDELAFELLKNFDGEGYLPEQCPSKVLASLSSKYEPAELHEAYQELLELCHQGLLCSSDAYADIAAQHNGPSPVKALCLHVAHDCNLRCEYCFAATGDFGQGRRLMDFETGKKSIDLVIQHSKGRRNIEIDFFGGEPLMNFEVVKEILEYAQQQGTLHGKNFRFTITTNGLLLNQSNMDYINRNMSNVVLSLDGRKAVNDKVRCHINGSGCYDTIVPKLLSMAQKRHQTDYYVRGTFTKYNKDFTKDVLHLADLGFEQISIEPVVSDETRPYALTQSDLDQVFLEYETLAQGIYQRKTQNQGFNFFHFMLDLGQGPCVIKRLHGCGSGNEYLAVTPDGDIYPCHQFVGIEEYKMGNVHDGFQINEQIKQQFAQNNIYAKPECQDCWAKFYCSGGCNANNFQYNKDIHKPHHISCEMEKKRLECAIWLNTAFSK